VVSQLSLSVAPPQPYVRAACEATGREAYAYNEEHLFDCAMMMDTFTAARRPPGYPVTELERP
jgi:hypothetical protein